MVLHLNDGRERSTWSMVQNMCRYVPFVGSAVVIYVPIVKSSVHIPSADNPKVLISPRNYPSPLLPFSSIRLRIQRLL